MIEGIYKGQIYYADLGLKQKKRVLIVSSDEMNNHPLWDKVIVVYVTSKQGLKGAWVELSCQKGESTANCTEILTIPKKSLKQRVGNPLPQHELKEVYKGVAIAMGAEGIFRELYS